MKVKTDWEKNPKNRETGLLVAGEKATMEKYEGRV